MNLYLRVYLAGYSGRVLPRWLRRLAARHAVGLGDVAAEVPDPLAVRRRMSGDGHPWLRPTTQTMRVQRLQRRPLGQHHMQRTQLLSGLLDAQCGEQLGVTRSRTEHHALRTNRAPIDNQPAQLAIVLQRFDTFGRQQAVASQLGQTDDQARHIEHQLSQTIDLALELRMLQRRR